MLAPRELNMNASLFVWSSTGGIGLESLRVGHCDPILEWVSQIRREHLPAPAVTGLLFCGVNFLRLHTLVFADAVFCSPSHLHARPLCMLYPPTAPRRPLPPVSAAQIIKFTSSFLPRSALCNGEQRGADHFLLFNRIRKGVSFDCTGPAGIRKRARNADRGTFPRGCSRRL